MRGDPRCQKFCSSCQKDCLCNCGDCHTCRDIRTFDRYYYSNHRLPGCTSYIHDCTTRKVLNDLEREVVKNLLTFPKLFNSDIIEISIGKDGKEIRKVPKNALLEHSEYFKAAFSFNEKVGTASQSKSELVLDMEVDRPHAFDKFIQFAYWNDYTISDSLPSEHDDLDLRIHAEVYLFAERLQAEQLKDLALRKATTVATESSKRVAHPEIHPDAIVNLACIPDIIEMIYLNTPDKSPNGDISVETEAIKDIMKNSNETTTSRDRFRALIVAFSAACLKRLKAIDGFLGSLAIYPDFAVDLVREIPEGKPLEVDENGYLKTAIASPREPDLS